MHTGPETRGQVQEVCFVRLPLEQGVEAAAVLVGTAFPFLQRCAESKLVCGCVLRQNINSHLNVWANGSDAHCLPCFSFIGFPENLLREGAQRCDWLTCWLPFKITVITGESARLWHTCISLSEQSGCVGLVLWSLLLCSIGAPSDRLCFSILSYPMGMEVPENSFYLHLGDSERNRHQETKALPIFSIKKDNNEVIINEIKHYGQIVSSDS